MSSREFLQRQQQNAQRRQGSPNPDTPAGVVGNIGAGALFSTSSDSITLQGPPSGNTYNINLVNDPPLGFSKGTRLRITDKDNVSIWAEGPITAVAPGPNSGLTKFTIVSDRENVPGTSSNWRAHVAMPLHRYPQIHFSDARAPGGGGIADGLDGDTWIHVDSGSNTLIFSLKKFGVWTEMIKFQGSTSSGGAGENSSSGGDSGGDGGGAE